MTTQQNSQQSKIHPAAIVEPGAKIGNNVTIEAYAVIKQNVTLKDGVTIKSHAYIDGNTTIGENTTIYPSASIGTKSQDLKFKGETTYVSIGKNCEIREFVTINSSTQENTTVRIGDNCLLMAYCHVAHNCELGDNVIMSNNATLAGHVIVENNAIIGGLTPIHQFVRVGKYAMVGGMSRVTHDIPPFTIGAGIPYKFGGLNMIGLKRNNFSLEARVSLSKTFKLLYRSGLYFEEALERIKNEVEKTPEVEYFLNFCAETKRGLMGLHGVTHQCDGANDLLEEYEECTSTLKC